MRYEYEKGTKYDKGTIGIIFRAMDIHDGDVFETVAELDGMLSDSDINYFIENYHNFYGVWDCYRSRRIDEMYAVLDTADEVDADDVLDFFNHLPANNK